MGLIVQLGHPVGDCLDPLPAHKDFVVMDTNGMHNVSIRFCGCSTVSRPAQLLRYGWYPATTTLPKTCVTLRLLKLFHQLTLQGKVSGYEVYRALENLTDNTGSVAVPERYKEFMRCIRQYRHLKMMMRAGRGNVEDGVATTSPGELAVRCPACPIPGVNLPPDWDACPPELR